MHGFRSHLLEVEIAASVISAVLMAVGFLPQIFEIYKSRSSMGLSKIFVCMDFMGGVFSIMSLAFHDPFDWLAFSTYIIVPIFQSIILVMIVYYHRRTSSFLPIEMDSTGNGIKNTGSGVHENLIPEYSKNPLSFSTVNSNYFSTQPGTTINSNNYAASMVQPQIISSNYILSQSQSHLIPTITTTTGTAAGTSTGICNGSGGGGHYLRSSTSSTSSTTKQQEFDHIVPESAHDSTDSIQKQNSILNQSTSILVQNATILHSNTNNNINLGYPVS
eukprot:gene3549-4423_t